MMNSTFNRCLKVMLAVSMLFGETQFASAQSSASQPPPINDENFIGQFLIETLPAYTGSADFFTDVNASQIADQLDESKIQNRELLRQIAVGRAYRKRLAETFAGLYTRASFGFLFNSDREVYRRILAARAADSAVQDKPLTETEAARLAWSEMLTRFPIMNGRSYQYLQTARFNDPSAHSAFDFYNRYYNRLLNQERRTRTKGNVDPHALKEELIRDLQAVRILNLQSFFTSLPNADHKDFIKIWDGETQASVTIPAHAFEKADLRMGKYQTSEAARTTWSRAPKPRFWTFLTPRNILNALVNVKGRSDWAEAQSFYKSSSIDLQLQTATITLNVNGKSYTFTESEFYKLLMNFRRSETNAVGSPNAFVNSQQLQIQQRDLMLALTIERLTSENDATLSHLKSRFQSVLRPSDNTDVPFNYDLNTQIKDLTSDRLPAVFELWWYGESLSPLYWSLRDIVAKKLHKPSYKTYFENSLNVESPKQTAPPTPRDRKLNKANVKRELRFKNYRESSVSGRSRSLVKTLTKAALFGALVVGAAYGAISILKNMPPSTGQSAANAEAIQPRFDKDDYIVSKEKMQSGAKSVIFHITEVGRTAKLPRMFYEFDFFQDTLNDSALLYDDSRFHSKWNYLPLKSYRSSHVIRNPTFFEILMVRHTAEKDGLLPVLAPVGFKLHSIELLDNDLNVIDPSDYRAVIVPENGQQFLIFNNSALMSSTYRYKAVYEPIPELASTDSDFIIRDETVREIQKELQDIGANELSQQFTKLMQVAPGTTVQAADLATAQMLSGLYTFEPRASFQPIQKTVSFVRRDKYRASISFLENGVLWYQCTGSNSLLSNMLSHAFEVQNQNSLKAQIINGYTLKGDFQATADGGHRQTLVTDTSKPFHYRIYDGTPANKDPSDKDDKGGVELPSAAQPSEDFRQSQLAEQLKPQPKKAPVNPQPKQPLPAKPADESLVGVLNVRRPEDNMQPVQEDTDTPAKIAKPNREPIERKTIQNNSLSIERLTELRHALITQINDVQRTTQTRFDFKIFPTLPGLNVLALSNTVVQVLEGKTVISNLVGQLFMSVNGIRPTANSNDVTEFSEQAKHHYQDRQPMEMMHHMLRTLAQQFEESRQLPQAHPAIKNQKISDLIKNLYSELEEIQISEQQLGPDSSRLSGCTQSLIGE